MENFNFFNPTEIISERIAKMKWAVLYLNTGKRCYCIMAAAPLKNPAFMIG